MGQLSYKGTTKQLSSRGGTWGWGWGESLNNKLEGADQFSYFLKMTGVVIKCNA